MSKERIYAHGKSGCAYETVHREDFERAALMIEVTPTAGGGYNLLEGLSYKILLKEKTAEITSNLFVRGTNSAGEEIEEVLGVADTLKPSESYSGRINFSWYMPETISNSSSYNIPILRNGKEETLRFYGDSSTEITTLTSGTLALSGVNIEKIYVYNAEAQVTVTAEDGKDALVFKADLSYGEEPTVGNSYSAEYKYFNRTPEAGEFFRILGKDAEDVNATGWSLLCEVTNVGEYVDYIIRESVRITGLSALQCSAMTIFEEDVTTTSGVKYATIGWVWFNRIPRINERFIAIYCDSYFGDPDEITYLIDATIDSVDENLQTATISFTNGNMHRLTGKQGEKGSDGSAISPLCYKRIFTFPDRPADYEYETTVNDYSRVPANGDIFNLTFKYSLNGAVEVYNVVAKITDLYADSSSATGGTAYFTILDYVQVA